MNLVAANKNVRSVAPFVLGPVLVESPADNGQQAAFARRMSRH